MNIYTPKEHSRFLIFKALKPDLSVSGYKGSSASGIAAEDNCLRTKSAFWAVYDTAESKIIASNRLEEVLDGVEETIEDSEAIEPKVTNTAITESTTVSTSRDQEESGTITETSRK